MISTWVTNATDTPMLASFDTAALCSIVFRAHSPKPWNSEANTVKQDSGADWEPWTHHFTGRQMSNLYDSSQSELEQFDSP